MRAQTCPPPPPLMPTHEKQTSWLPNNRASATAPPPHTTPPDSLSGSPSPSLLLSRRLLSFASPPQELRYDDASGRFLAASRALKRGDVALVSHPIATAVHGAHMNTTCHSCLATLVTPPTPHPKPNAGDDACSGVGDDTSAAADSEVRCELCDGAVYCGEGCRARDLQLHSIECAMRSRGGTRAAGSSCAASAAVASSGGAPQFSTDSVWTTRLMLRAAAWSQSRSSGSSGSGGGGGGGGGSGGGGDVSGSDELWQGPYTISFFSSTSA